MIQAPDFRLKHLNNLLRELTFIVLFAVPANSLSQISNSNFEHFTAKDGLPSQQVYHCFQDKDGFLWIGTDAGVSRFDGKTFVNFTTRNGLGDNEVFEIYQDKLERIWFIPFNGKLSYYYKGKFFHLNIDVLLEESSKGRRDNIQYAEDASGNIYLSKTESRKIIKIEAHKGTRIIYDLYDISTANGGFAAFYCTKDGRVYCITTNRRLILPGARSLQDVTPKGFLEKERPARFYINHKVDNYHVLFSGNEGIYKLENFKAELLVPKEKLPKPGNYDFLQMEPDIYNHLWVNHLQHNTLLFRKSATGYDDYVNILKNIYAFVTFDRENNIWLATNNGLYKTSYDKLEDKISLHINNNLVSQQVLSCTIDSDSGFWMGYNNGFVSRIKNKTITHFDLNTSGRTNNRIVQIKTDKQGNILVATDETVVVFRRLKKDVYSKPLRFKMPDGRPLKCSAKGVFFSPEGEAFLNEPFKGDVFQLDCAKLLLVNKSKKQGEEVSRRFSRFYDRHGRLYSSTNKGLSVFENDSLFSLSATDKRLNVRVQDYAQDRKGVIFLASYNNGIIAIRDRHFIADISLFNNASVICRRIYLKRDTIYVATNYGIAVLTFRSDRFSLLRMITDADKLISNDVNDLAFLGNRAFAVTSQGVSFFETSFKTKKEAVPPTLVICTIKTDDSLYTSTHIPELSHHTKLIRINFVAPVLDKPKLTLYRYRTNPFSKWQVTNANFVEFSTLTPGNYNIEIQAKKHNSNWSPSSKIYLRIKPPFYNTVWFISVLVITVLGSLFFFTRYILQRRFRVQLNILRQKEAIEKERNRIAADIHDDIGIELTNITFLSQSLKHTRSGGEDSLKTINRLENASAQVLIKMNEVIWTLNAKNDTLGSLMAYIRKYATSTFENTGIKLEILINDTGQKEHVLPAEYRRNIFLVVKELLHNAIKHSASTMVFLHIQLINKNRFQIEYRDNGIGFNINGTHTGNGLCNMKKRIAEYKGTFEIISSEGNGCYIKMLFLI
jgi:signal transduction histidine kinase